MKFNKRITLILLSIFFVGLSVLLYPSFASYWNSRNQTRMVTAYDNIVKDIKGKDYSNYFKQAKDYNKQLAKLKFPLLDYKQVKGYRDALNIDGSGMIGYVSVDKLQLELPIYHTVNDSVLVHAAGHLEGSSLPVGAKGNHSVISAHRGLAGAKLFTNLDRLEVGDLFKITVLDKVYIYEVDQIKTVLPNNVNDLKIEPDKDYCTLLTCTPYGINTHRLLVRGVRTDTLLHKTLFVSSEAHRINTVIVMSCVALPILFVLILYVMFKPAKKKITVDTLQNDKP